MDMLHQPGTKKAKLQAALQEVAKLKGIKAELDDLLATHVVASLKHTMSAELGLYA